MSLIQHVSKNDTVRIHYKSTNLVPGLDVRFDFLRVSGDYIVHNQSAIGEVVDRGIYYYDLTIPNEDTYIVGRAYVSGGLDVRPIIFKVGIPPVQFLFYYTEKAFSISPNYKVYDTLGIDRQYGELSQIPSTNFWYTTFIPPSGLGFVDTENVFIFEVDDEFQAQAFMSDAAVGSIIVCECFATVVANSVRQRLISAILTGNASLSAAIDTTPLASSTMIGQAILTVTTRVFHKFRVTSQLGGTAIISAVCYKYPLRELRIEHQVYQTYDDWENIYNSILEDIEKLEQTDLGFVKGGLYELDALSVGGEESPQTRLLRLYTILAKISSDDKVFIKGGLHALNAVPISGDESTNTRLLRLYTILANISLETPIESQSDSRQIVSKASGSSTDIGNASLLEKINKLANIKNIHVPQGGKHPVLIQSVTTKNDTNIKKYKKALANLDKV